MTGDATQGDWQPLADQPIVPENKAPSANNVVGTKPPDVVAPANRPDVTVPPPNAPANAAQPLGGTVPASYPEPAGHSAAGYPAADYLVSAPRRRRPLARLIGLVIIAALILAGLAFAVRTGSSGHSAASARTSPRTSAIPRSDGGPLDGYLLAPDDVGPGTEMTLAPDGRSLVGAGGVTLDFCDDQFASEKLRVERVQAQYDGPAGSASNEVVKYKAGGTDAAFAEIKKAVSTCGTGYRDGTGTVSHIQQSTGYAGLALRHVVVSFEQQVSDQGQTSFWVSCVYQFDGDYFSGVYVYSADEASARDLAQALALGAARYLHEAASGIPGTGGGPLPENSGPKNGGSANGGPGLPA